MAFLFRNSIAALFACAAFAAPSFAQEIKISHQFKANTDARDKATRVFVEEVNKKDPGLKFRIYPGSSLNIKPVAQFDALQTGTLEMAVFPMSYAVGKVPEFSVTIMPGTIERTTQARRISVTSAFRYSATPAHTPASLPLAGSRVSLRGAPPARAPQKRP